MNKMNIRHSHPLQGNQSYVPWGIEVYNFILVKSCINMFFISNIPNNGYLLTSGVIFAINR